ncbi:MAG: hypothetical protein NTV01_12965 [Bacteroidia bacterium]|nr:hypothetical protein [Bacteroidia bacterium]
MKEVNTGQLIELPKVGHGFSVASSWLPQFVEAYNRVLVYPPYTGQKPIRDTLPQSLKHLPLNEDFPIVPIPATVKDSLPIAFLISGDGGWTGFDYSIGKSLADKGIPVIGLDAQKYFWKLKTPEETATEVSRALTYYMQEWKKTKFILAGYSYGACIIPFIATRLPGDLQGSLIGIYGLSPDITVDFEVHITDMIGFGRAADSFKVADEIKKIRQFQPVCIFGESESADLRTRFSEAGAKIITIPGNHHYNARPSAPADAIFREVEAIRNK